MAYHNGISQWHITMASMAYHNGISQWHITLAVRTNNVDTFFFVLRPFWFENNFWFDSNFCNDNNSLNVFSEMV